MEVQCWSEHRCCGQSLGVRSQNRDVVIPLNLVGEIGKMTSWVNESADEISGCYSKHWQDWERRNSKLGPRKQIKGADCCWQSEGSGGDSCGQSASLSHFALIQPNTATEKQTTESCTLRFDIATRVTKGFGHCDISRKRYPVHKRKFNRKLIY